jgi:N-acetylglucosamine-6-sulfatase
MPINRRQLLGALAAPAWAAPRISRPNLVFIYTDDQRWDAMSCAGHPFLKTPNIDRIAREGARFRNAFVTTPLCSPSRACFLTGQYAHTHRVTTNGNNNALSHELVTFPRLLQRAGYETAFIGKWHMGNDDTPRPGFDRWVSFRGQGRYDDPPLNIDGAATQAQGYMTDLLGGHAVEFLRRQRSKPFLMCLAHKAVHGPFTPAERHKSLYSVEPIPRPPNVKDTLEGKPALRRQAGEKQYAPQAAALLRGPNDDLVRNQLRTLMAVDDSVGQVLAVLEETGQLDNTWVIFTSDNGYFWGEHGLGDKRAAYEESVRIPLVVRYPRLIRAGAVLEDAVLSIDVAPTLLELGGAPPSKEMQGRSLVPLLGGRRGGWRKSFLAEYFAEPQFPRIPTWQAVRTDRWKYIHYTELEGMDELYDLKADPYEMQNLISQTRAAGALRQMKAELERLLKETS